jgi:hypothetical protein
LVINGNADRPRRPASGNSGGTPSGDSSSGSGSGGVLTQEEDAALQSFYTEQINRARKQRARPGVRDALLSFYRATGGGSRAPGAATGWRSQSGWLEAHAVYALPRAGNQAFGFADGFGQPMPNGRGDASDVGADARFARRTQDRDPNSPKGPGVNEAPRGGVAGELEPWFSDPCTGKWEGIVCKDGTVIALDLSGNGLAGQLPNFLGLFGALESLALADNALTGPIPASLCSLTRLRFLDLHGNRLSGPIPACIGALSEVEVLALHGNDLSGPAPYALAHLPHLRALYLHGNVGLRPFDPLARPALQLTGEAASGDGAAADAAGGSGGSGGSSQTWHHMLDAFDALESVTLPPALQGVNAVAADIQQASVPRPNPAAASKAPGKRRAKYVDRDAARSGYAARSKGAAPPPPPPPDHPDLPEGLVLPDRHRARFARIKRPDPFAQAPVGHSAVQWQKRRSAQMQVEWERTRGQFQIEAPATDRGFDMGPRGYPEGGEADEEAAFDGASERMAGARMAAASTDRGGRTSRSS